MRSGRRPHLDAADRLGRYFPRPRQRLRLLAGFRHREARDGAQPGRFERLQDLLDLGM